MTVAMTPKTRAAAAALDFVSDGMTLGLGTGSTATAFIDLLGARVAKGLEIRAIPTSEASRRQAEALGIEIIQPDETTQIDIAIDGTDEATLEGHLIKGGGGAHLREKIIATAAKKFVVIADASKRVNALGAFPLPIELDPFSWPLTVSAIREALHGLGYKSPTLSLRPGTDRGVFMSDGGHYILDAALGRIPDPIALDRTLTDIPGVVTTGLFVGLTDVLIFGQESGTDIVEVR